MKKESTEELNRLGQLWYEADPEMKLRIAEDLFRQAYLTFPSYTEEIGTFFAERWKNYDPAKGNLAYYMSKCLKKLKTDMYYKDNDHVPDKTVHLSFATPISNDGEKTLLDQYSDDHLTGDMLEKVIYDEGMVQFITLSLNFSLCLNGRANNEAKINYYRMFFTDDVVKILQRGGAQAPFEARERELFSGAIKTAFLDFFMAKRCRRVRELQFCPLKPYGEMVEGRPMEEPGQPLPNEVYITYLNTMENRNIKSAGTISSQRTEYEDFVRKNLCLPSTD